MIFATGMLMGGGVAFDLPVLSLLALPVSVVAVALIPIRMRRRIRATSWSRPSEARYASSGIVWLVAAFVLFGYLSAAYPDGFPHHLTVVFFHALFVGGMTNILIGVVRQATGEGKPARALGEAIYWGLNAGLLVFIVGLFADAVASFGWGHRYSAWPWSSRLSCMSLGSQTGRRLAGFSRLGNTSSSSRGRLV